VTSVAFTSAPASGDTYALGEAVTVRATASEPVTVSSYGEVSTLVGHTKWVLGVAFSPDGARIASAANSVENGIKVWDAATGAVIHTLNGHTDPVRWVTYSPDGTRIVSSAADNNVIVWDGATGSLLRTLTGHTAVVHGVAYSPEGSRIVSASADNTVKVWDAATGSLVATLTGHTDRVISVAYSPDGSRVASGADDTTVRVWDAATGSFVATLSGHTNVIRTVAYSPDGSKIVSGSLDSSIKIWDAATGSLERTITYTAGIWSASFSPDGTRIVSGSRDSAVKVWDADTGSEIATLSGHTGEVRSAVFSPDGTRIASGAQDNTVKVWGVVPFLALTVGAAARAAVYDSGSGTTELTFRYTVRAGDNDADGVSIARHALGNASLVADAYGIALVQAYDAVADSAGHKVDTPPVVKSAAFVSSYPPGQVAYREGDTVTVRLTFSEPVSLTGVGAGGANEARVALTVGTASRTAVAAAATSGSATVDLAYTVQAGDNDADGVAIEGGLVLGGTAAVRDADGNDAVPAFMAVPSGAAHVVDALAPSITDVSVVSSYPPGQSAYEAGDKIAVRVAFSEPVSLTGVDAGGANEARVALTVGAAGRTAIATAATSASETVYLNYVVRAGDNDGDGVAIVGGLVLGGTAAVRDDAGNDAVLAFASVADIPRAKVLPGEFSAWRAGGHAPAASGRCGRHSARPRSGEPGALGRVCVFFR